MIVLFNAFYSAVKELPRPTTLEEELTALKRELEPRRILRKNLRKIFS